MSTFLITGGAGYVGSHTVKALARAGHTCVTFDDLSRGHRELVRWGPLTVGDIRDRTALDGVFAEHQIDCVLHFAALAYVGESVEMPDLYYDVNVNGTRRLLDAMLTAGVTRIVFSSTCAVYGAPSTRTISETLPKAPINPYGFSKLACEQMMDDYERAFGVRSARLRYFNAAGADPEGEIGEDHNPETHLIPLVLEAAAGARPAIDILGVDYDTPDGTTVRDYVHVSDLATAHVAAADHLLQGGATFAANLATGVGASVRDVIRTAEKVTGKSIPVRERDRRPGDPPSLVAKADLAREVLNWTPRRSDLHAIVQDAWAWRQRRFGGAS